MKKHINVLLLTTTTLLLFILPSSSSSSSPDSAAVDLTYWCNKTPHPRACLHYLATHSKEQFLHRADFFTLSVHAAFNSTLRAHSHLQNLCAATPRCHKSRRTRKAFNDCNSLYANTLFHLNRTLVNDSPHRNCTPVDAQTWLSAALTNLRTCRKGFSDVKASYRVIEPVNLKYNVSELISNCLAINCAYNNMTASTGVAPPPIIPKNSRMLLQSAVRADFVVAKDGSSRYNNVQAAVNAANGVRLRGSTRRISIYVKAGVYNEIVTVPSTLTDLTMIGDGMGQTIITGARSVGLGYTTFSSPTFSVFGDRFIGSSMTFRNTYGPGSQAVALLSGSDESVFYRCSIEGYQDTLCVYTQRQFYTECDIYGTIDFIFGNAAVVIQNCNILVRKPNHGEANVITAQGRADPNQNTGIVIQFSRIRAAPELVGAGRSVQSFLGRPWMLYSRTLYVQNVIDDIIDPAGWLPYNGNFALSTLFYGEFKNTGPGSRMRFRVKWRGYHVLVKPSQVRKFTVAYFIAGGAWLPAAGVPFRLGLQ